MNGHIKKSCLLMNDVNCDNGQKAVLCADLQEVAAEAEHWGHKGHEDSELGVGVAGGRRRGRVWVAHGPVAMSHDDEGNHEQGDLLH